MSRIVRSKVYVLICPYLDQMNGRCQNKSILILAFCSDLLEQRFCVGKTKYILIPLSRNLTKVWNMHAWFSFLLSVPSAQNRHVKFILIKFLPHALPHYRMQLKVTIKWIHSMTVLLTVFPLWPSLVLRQMRLSLTRRPYNNMIITTLSRPWFMKFTITRHKTIGL
jgi:hypothetical protein